MNDKDWPPMSFDQWHQLFQELRLHAETFRNAQAPGYFFNKAQDLYDCIYEAAAIAYQGTEAELGEEDV